MRNILSDEQLATINEVGILSVAVPFPYMLDAGEPDINSFAADYLKAHYTLNWQQSALLVDFTVKGGAIFLKFINSEVLQLILIDTCLGEELFNELKKLGMGSSFH